jgi:hypothetical protein
MCETEMTPSHGLLKVVGPIYRRGDAVCCPIFTETTYRRWTGDHFHVTRRGVARNHD